MEDYLNIIQNIIDIVENLNSLTFEDDSIVFSKNGLLTADYPNFLWDNLLKVMTVLGKINSNEIETENIKVNNVIFGKNRVKQYFYSTF